MNVETRKSAAATEYWDAKEKRVRFVSAGKKPDFEVTENPKSMILKENDGKGKQQEEAQGLESYTL